ELFFCSRRGRHAMFSRDWRSDVCSSDVIVAWGGEGLGFFLIWRGFGVEGADLAVSIFLFAFSTIAGAPAPGGLGVADVALQEGAARLIVGITQAQAVGAALVCRLATLWLGVVVGAIALFTTGASL